jgi:acetyl-CoA carboxylase biotin carboxyl carrier protein
VELKDIKAIIDLMRKNDLSVFEMEKDGFRLKLQKGISDQPMSMAPAQSAPAMQNGPANAGPAQPVSAPAETSHLRDIVSPMVGTFYRAASPDAPAFVDVGKEVTEETVVCIIEAMKVMNEIKAETKGVINSARCCIACGNAARLLLGRPVACHRFDLGKRERLPYN